MKVQYCISMSHVIFSRNMLPVFIIFESNEQLTSKFVLLNPPELFAKVRFMYTLNFVMQWKMDTELT
jgi:hypothetical protein